MGIPGNAVGMKWQCLRIPGNVMGMPGNAMGMPRNAMGMQWDYQEMLPNALCDLVHSYYSEQKK